MNFPSKSSCSGSSRSTATTYAIHRCNHFAERMTYASGWISVDLNVRKKCQSKQIFYSSILLSCARGRTDRFEIQMFANSRPNEVCNRNDVCVQNVYELCISIPRLHVCLPLETIWSSTFFPFCAQQQHRYGPWWIAFMLAYGNNFKCSATERAIRRRLVSRKMLNFWIIWESTNLCIRHS